VKVVLIAGTRPELIKLYPVYLEGLRDPRCHEIKVIYTGQHEELAWQVFDVFGFEPCYILKTMVPGQGVCGSFRNIVDRVQPLLKSETPDLVIVQGDTTSAAAGALCAYFSGIPVCHVEAGLRTHNLKSPYPEEGIRRTISQVADLHCLLHEDDRVNLPVPNESVVVGSTAVDAIVCVGGAVVDTSCGSSPKKLLVTMHRRENQAGQITQVCRAVKWILKKRVGELEVNWIRHPNPQVEEVVQEELEGVEGINLIEPVGYVAFLKMMREAWVILSDSGGIQEEANYLKVPVLVLRKETERQAAVTQNRGICRLVGTDTNSVIVAVETILSDSVRKRLVESSDRYLYGKGFARYKIWEFIWKLL